MTKFGKNALIFLGGVLFGTAGIKAALRAKDSVMKTVTKVQENAEDIYAEAKQINIEREESEQPVELELDDVKPAETETEPEKTVEENKDEA